jgi:hypothetical protein
MLERVRFMAAGRGGRVEDAGATAEEGAFATAGV